MFEMSVSASTSWRIWIFNYTKTPLDETLAWSESPGIRKITASRCKAEITQSHKQNEKYDTCASLQAVEADWHKAKQLQGVYVQTLDRP